ncbi:MAG: hypothetical protein HYS45_00755 [Parcubacteria group bacterium]|nr:hypothetical protein [Parcubacteria group bacterium]
MLTKRTNILFSGETWTKLERLARTRGSSVGELVRNAVHESYFDDTRERAKEAYESILRNRKRVSGTLDYKALINEGRRV